MRVERSEKYTKVIQSKINILLAHSINTTFIDARLLSPRGVSQHS